MMDDNERWPEDFGERLKEVVQPRYGTFICEDCDGDYFTGPAWRDECYCLDCYIIRFNCEWCGLNQDCPNCDPDYYTELNR